MSAIGSHAKAWFGGFVDEPSSMSADRYLHPLEARTYKLNPDGTLWKAILPYDVRNWELGWYFTIWNVGTSDFLPVVTRDLVTVSLPNGQLLKGTIGYVVLTDNSTAQGSWIMFVRGQGAGVILG